MNPTIFDQGDPRWGSLPYPRGSSTVKTDGCGLCAVTHCAIELKKYWGYTPKDTISFMRQYAVYDNGTEWAGIDAGLDKYIGNHKRHYNMSSFFTEMKKGNRVGVILFGKGTSPDGTVWTLSGHYVAVLKWKYEAGQNWLFCKDSSWRKLSGWKSYEKSMKGCIPDVLWTAEIMKDGWLKEKNKWYYYENGMMLKNGWAKDSKGKWFYLGTDGAMVSSKWVKWRDNWYYLKDNGEMAASEWAKDKKGWCYLNKDGKMVKSVWVKWKDNMYYVDDKGYMVTGSADVPCKFKDSGKLIIGEDNG